MTKEYREQLKAIVVDLYNKGYGFEDIIKEFRKDGKFGLGLDARRYVNRLVKRLDEKKEK